MRQDLLLHAPRPGGLPDRLLTRLPVAARGLAMASWLLSDGTGPVHNHRCPPDLSAVVPESARQMGSFADTQPDGADPDNAERYR